MAVFPASDGSSNLFELNVLGVQLRCKHDSDLEHLREVETLLRHQVEITQRFSNARDPLRVAVLTAFRLVGDLMAERGERAMLPSISMVDGREIERLFQEMLSSLEEFSSPAAPPHETK